MLLYKTFTYFFLPIYLFVSVSGHLHAMVPVWLSKDNLWGQHVAPVDQTQVIKSVAKHLYPLFLTFFFSTGWIGEIRGQLVAST